MVLLHVSFVQTVLLNSAVDSVSYVHQFPPLHFKVIKYCMNNNWALWYFEWAAVIARDLQFSKLYKVYVCSSWSFLGQVYKKYEILAS